MGRPVKSMGRTCGAESASSFLSGPTRTRSSSPRIPQNILPWRRKASPPNISFSVTPFLRAAAVRMRSASPWS
jgi:hypothetical protein